jgi:hypothetical protein
MNHSARIQPIAVRIMYRIMMPDDALTSATARARSTHPLQEPERNCQLVGGD